MICDLHKKKTKKLMSEYSITNRGDERLEMHT
jgi:hypothetical protein